MEIGELGNIIRNGHYLRSEGEQRRLRSFNTSGKQRKLCNIVVFLNSPDYVGRVRKTIMKKNKLEDKVDKLTKVVEKLVDQNSFEVPDGAKISHIGRRTAPTPKALPEKERVLRYVNRHGKRVDVPEGNACLIHKQMPTFLGDKQGNKTPPREEFAKRAMAMDESGNEMPIPDDWKISKKPSRLG